MEGYVKHLSMFFHKKKKEKKELCVSEAQTETFQKWAFLRTKDLSVRNSNEKSLIIMKRANVWHKCQTKGAKYADLFHQLVSEEGNAILFPNFSQSRIIILTKNPDFLLKHFVDLGLY